MLKKILFLFFSFSLFLLTFSQANAASGLVPCGLGATDPCTLCHFLIGIQGLINWGMKIIVTISITGISIAGIMYVVSSGDPTFATKAKGFIQSVVIGFSLMLGAWLIINTVFWVFSAKKEGDKGAFGIEGKSWTSFSCSTTSSSVGSLTPSTEAPISGYSKENFKFQSGIDSQMGDASSSLQTLIVCLRNKLGSKMTINSISDSAGLDKCSGTGYAKPPCAHEKGSCHYGGVAGGKSEAVDISTTTGLTVGNITTAAKECGISDKSIKDESSEANHVHVSTNNCQRGY